MYIRDCDRMELCRIWLLGQCFPVSGPRNVARDSVRNSGMICTSEISRNKFANIARRIAGIFIRQLAILE